MFDRILLALSEAVDKEEVQRFTEDITNTSGVCVEKLKSLTQLSAYQGENTILITDMADCFSRSYKLKIPGVVYLHKQNRKIAFMNMTYAITSLEELPLIYLERVYERFFRIPWKILKTQRCLIREITLEDVDALYEIYKDKEITRYMENLFEDKEKEREYTKMYIDSMYNFYGFGMWIVESLEDGKILGRAGLNIRDGYEDPEIGYIIRKDEQQKGYATEVCQGIIQYAVEELEVQALNAFIHPENMNSIKLIEKLSFKKDDIVEIEGEMLQRYIWKK